jgi:NarL family two-component system response regulator LiaR
MGAVRVALSNDYEIAIRGLAALLQDHADEVKVVELTTSCHATESVDVILFDTFGRLPHDQKLREVLSANQAQVIVYTWDSYPVDAFAGDGAAACIHKGATAAQLVEAILAVHEGRAVRHDIHAPTGVDEMSAWPGQIHGLSAREAEILIYVASGLSNQEIAERAYLSINTVKTYIRTAYAKIGVTRRSQAVVWALEHGLQPDYERRSV